MRKIVARNVNDAFISGLMHLSQTGELEETRNGPALVAPTPVMTEYQAPLERVLFNPNRHANPFFHLMESIWMLAGSNDILWLSKFNSNMLQYSDDGKTQRGAYGHRWRKFFGYDQLEVVVDTLRSNPLTRRAMLGMWTPEADQGAISLDIPCNTHCYFRVREETLEMTICCRSNDAVWGAYGANAVHFSYLLEYVARAANLEVGSMYQLSNNLHIYKQHWPLMDKILPHHYDHYRSGMVIVPLFSEPWQAPAFLSACEDFIFRGERCDTRSLPFFENLALPALRLWKCRDDDWRTQAATMLPSDWKLAMIQWLERREA